MSKLTPQPNFVLEFTRLCKGTEIPELFAVWSSLGVVGATLGRNVWLDMEFFMVFPNLFIVLVASSGRFRKSTSIEAAVDLLKESNVEPAINFISQTLTPEALIGSLLGGQRQEGNGDLICEGFVVADELSTFLNRKYYDLGIAPLLINFFDCKRRYVYETKKRGKEILNNICLGMLAGSTISSIRNAIPSDAVGGGLTSRLIFVYANIPPKPVARIRLSEEQLTIRAELPKVLEEIRKLRGPVVLTPQSWELYEEAYVKHCETSPFFIVPFLSGYASRWHVHMLKVAMILSVSERPLKEPVEVLPRHITGAIQILEASEVYMPKILTLITSTERGALGEMMACNVEQMGEGGVGRADLMRSVAHKITVREFEELVGTLVAAGRIERLAGPGGTRYRARK